ncbi:alpha-ketoglutarate-dependent dioxygenase AlkB [Hoyosella sp. G463]|uniref:Alpha-ketoglutarate-dependent dioxygenase AlkB n=1 Tax=Lolliginicoccus lacisalsi TaxID=2742202 RepID=A0A927JB22_9ACTN|nr:alpha-ketoglutarate-dependent dioxygenase AlkB [Lolliginicoccus lacisalsi]
MADEIPDLLGASPVPVADGATWLPGWLAPAQQRWLADQFRAWAAGPVPASSPLIHGNRMSTRMVCLGWHWTATGYRREASDVNGQRVLAVPEWAQRLGRAAVAAARGAPAPDYQPDVILANYYSAEARMGMHQDKDEQADAPVVSLSIGDTCTFRFGNTRTRARPYADIPLASGDAFVFEGPARLAYHGVTRIHPGTAPPGCGLDSGRISMTFRMTGLPG